MAKDPKRDDDENGPFTGFLNVTSPVDDGSVLQAFPAHGAVSQPGLAVNGRINGVSARTYSIDGGAFTLSFVGVPPGNELELRVTGDGITETVTGLTVS